LYEHAIIMQIVQNKKSILNINDIARSKQAIWEYKRIISKELRDIRFIFLRIQYWYVLSIIWKKIQWILK